MRRLGIALALTSVIVTLATVAAHARWQRPRISPRDTVKATVDGGNFTIEYGRPSKRGRVIWGSLVPWNHWWMPGADESSTIVTDVPVVFAGSLTMPAGTHTIYTLPGDSEFKLIISKDVGTFHTQYHPDQDLGRVHMTLKKLTEPVEQMTLAVEPHEGGGGVFKLTWDDREYSVPFVVHR